LDFRGKEQDFRKVENRVKKKETRFYANRIEKKLSKYSKGARVYKMEYYR